MVEGERLRPMHHQSAVEHHSGQWHQYGRLHAGAVAGILLGLQRQQRGATRSQSSPTMWTRSRFSALSTRRRRTGSSGCRAAFSTGLSSTSAGSSCLSCAASLGVERRRSSRLFGGRTAGITGRRKPALDWWRQFSDLRLPLQCARGYPDLWRLGQSADPLHPRRSDQSRFQAGNGRFHASDINIAARGCRHESRLCCDSGVTDGLLGTEG